MENSILFSEFEKIYGKVSIFDWERKKNENDRMTYMSVAPLPYFTHKPSQGPKHMCMAQ